MSHNTHNNSAEKKAEVTTLQSSTVATVLTSLKKQQLPFKDITLYPLEPNRIIKESMLGISTSIAVNMSFMPYMAVCKSFKKMNSKEYFQHLLKIQNIDTSALKKPTFMWNACLVAPIVEELIFRGAIFPAFKSTLNIMGMKEQNQNIGAALGSSAVFAAGHPKGTRIPIFFSGLSYTAITILSGGSLWASTAAHATDNIIATACLATGIRRYKL